ncbi:hypothetical protein F383_34704 [Gossypium arboreum]|uniref:Uncharacterized protein n=1 Tax=Gossypium arboreum TaxID=29729 RepID=A0A0B0MZ25_GOSAR|nr:hypothetical protein F383_34704 [Gossypium arboreum]
MKIDSSRLIYIAYSLFNTIPTNFGDFSHSRHCSWQHLFLR